MINYRLIIKIVLIVTSNLFLLLLALFIYVGVKKNYKTIGQALQSEYKISKEDSILLAELGFTDFSVKEVYRSSVRNPIALLTKNNFHLVLFKLKYSLNDRIPDIVTVSNRPSDLSIMKSYRILFENPYELAVIGDSVPEFSEIYLNMYGDSLRTIQSTDSLVHYRFLNRNISMRYLKDAPFDIVFNNERGDKFRTDIILVTKNQVLYVVVSTVLAQ